MTTVPGSLTPPEDHVKPKNARRAAVAAAAGTAVEYYEFGVYGYLAVVIGPLFFPSSNPTASLLSTLAVFGSAFLMRPLGGIVLGRLGDRIGRKPVLITTVVGMGTATAVVGLLPTAESIGILAPLALLLVRLAQGFFAGGEVTGSATYLAESAPNGRRGFFGAFTPVGVAIGGGTAALVAGLTSTILSDDQLRDFGWRIPFLLALPLIVVTLMARRKLEDSHEFLAVTEKERPAKTPLREVFTEHTGALFKVIFLAIGSNTGYWVGLIFMNIYLTTYLGYSKSNTFWIMGAISLFVATLMPIFGGLSDKHGRKRIITIGFLGYAILVLPAMIVMDQGSFALAVGAMVVLALPMPIVQSVTYPTYAEQFPTRVRYTGLSFAFNIGTIIGGGLTPYLATWLISKTDNLLMPGFLLIFAAVLALVTLTTVRESSKEALL
ncbi:MFS transporter [Rhodococcus sp. BP-252]|uniref:MFS transporter n=1 Tax=unclassified Rhodococcus (in: high G+C Gram-positive bacteria) TaxID=192944 RepID=UPI001C9B5ECA|nr:MULTISPECIES: MFS transporter [unclassified Rhodococcus (in: high G+C Gram-positive bacteria)]MBY6414117.1 MFS transporter [Rhodococcus sp. BP-320]MBY6418908.1 MFS transporter [Rhodococcus sp. BP-321]MBY6423605.1 MFS transporter [Rhodococcus sp. BP-324]MBY6428942.1 MFS transporter [Rhodococcus sp. BP-323]MBY6433947.1 MFS transporter [Rhodococcus sp. BP-322]